MDIKTALTGLLLLILIDLVTGIIGSYTVNKIPFNPFKKIFYTSLKSNGLRQTWKKTYEYLIGVIAITVIEIAIIGQLYIEVLGRTYSLTELAILVAGGIEVWSIFENLEKVSKENFLRKLVLLLPEKLQFLFTRTPTKEEVEDKLDKSDDDTYNDGELI